jgi:hypothetical protein
VSPVQPEGPRSGQLRQQFVGSQMSNVGTAGSIERSTLRLPATITVGSPAVRTTTRIAIERAAAGSGKYTIGVRSASSPRFRTFGSHADNG